MNGGLGILHASISGMCQIHGDHSMEDPMGSLMNRVVISAHLAVAGGKLFRNRVGHDRLSQGRGILERRLGQRSPLREDGKDRPSGPENFISSIGQFMGENHSPSSGSQGTL